MIRCAMMLALASVFCLAGCGQKGPLRLPEPEAAKTQAPATEPTETEPTEKEQE